MAKTLWTLLLLSISLTANAYNRYVYVTNPDLTKYEMSWNGPTPNCHETNIHGDTYGWIFHGYGATPIDVYLKSKLLNNNVCTVIISDDIKTTFPTVIGKDCYFVKSNGSDVLNSTSSYSTWITTTDTVPYQSHACGG